MKFILLFLLSFAPVFANVSRNEVVAAVIIGEAGGEGERGMQAVANVIANRMRPNKDAFDVVTAPKQFSSILGKEHEAFVAKAKTHKRWAIALDYANRIKELPDITNGATHFDNPRKMPYWAASMIVTKQIGNHLFFKENPKFY